MLLRSKYPKNLKYQIEAQWDGNLGGSAESKNGSCVKFDIPITFNGPGKAFCPDELLAASVAGCLMNTFLHFCVEMKLELDKFLLNTYIEVEFERGRYQIKNLNTEGALTVKKGDEELGKECIRLAQDHCHITNALSPQIPIDYNIIIQNNPK